jgi:Mn-dependent DtxR family transcriptional regulator
MMAVGIFVSEGNTMSTKERKILDFYWGALRDLNAATHRYVSVGELAREMGVARNTASKYLKAMLKHGAIKSHDYEFPNGTIGKVYAIVKIGEDE